MTVRDVAGSRLTGRGPAHPFVAHHPRAWRVAESWSDGRDDDGSAALVRIVPPDGRAHDPVLVGLGDPVRLAALLADLGPERPVARPYAVSLTRGTGDLVPDVVAGWGLCTRSAWDRLGIERLPDLPAGTPDVDRVAVLDAARDAADIEACLAAANPTTEHRPGDARTTWYGWRDADGTLATVACATTPPDGGLAYLGAVATHPERRGRGRAAAVTARATVDGLREHGLVILDLYADNDTARRLYRRLGFALVHQVETWRPAGT